MHIIESVSITGFWGNKSVKIDLADEVNFLIGVNGSGKTTIINLIAATISADFQTLKKHLFRSIKINLKNLDNHRIKPYIEIKKNDNLPYSLSYKIRLEANKKPYEYFFENFENDFWYRHSELNYPGYSTQRRDVLRVINQALNISWLSIHRTEFNSPNFDEESYESSVDRKLDQLSNSFIKYFSKLNKAATQETEEFQKYIFLSLLSDESEKQIFTILDEINPQNEKSSLIDIFNLFKLDSKVYSKKLKNHFDSYTEAYRKFEQAEGISVIDASYLIGTRRIHSVVQEWEKLLEKQNKIYSPRDTFLEVINSLLQNKRLLINDKNELIVETESGKNLLLKGLSSGEKQLVIILGESLLQEEEPHIYIADEPELSLHIGWQEKLVSSLKKLNPNSQIIFATHSPDIVSEYSKFVIKIEEFISDELQAN